MPSGTPGPDGDREPGPTDAAGAYGDAHRDQREAALPEGVGAVVLPETSRHPGADEQVAEPMGEQVRGEERGHDLDRPPPEVLPAGLLGVNPSRQLRRRVGSHRRGEPGDHRVRRGGGARCEGAIDRGIECLGLGSHLRVDVLSHRPAPPEAW